MLTEHQILTIHKVLHSKHSGIKINSKIYNVQTAPNTGCRFIQFGNIKFIEQNKDQTKTSVYAQEARQGAEITWAIPDKVGYRWGLIKDSKIIRSIPGV
jgi:hypothetical protein